MSSPYGSKHKKWPEITADLIAKHPLKPKYLSNVVLECWDILFESDLGGFKIGSDIIPKPQIMAFLLEELITLRISKDFPKLWRKEKRGSDKDLVYIPNDGFSTEVKTSSNPKHIYGNRSYAQKSKKGKKSKTGYYLAINFDKFEEGGKRPEIKLIRMGWLDHKDWKGQKAATGQQANLSAKVEKGKLSAIYEKP